MYTIKLPTVVDIEIDRDDKGGACITISDVFYDGLYPPDNLSDSAIGEKIREALQYGLTNFQDYLPSEWKN